MRRTCFIFLLLAAASGAAFAQQDPQAGEILDQMAARTEKYGTIHLHFTITTIDQQNNTREEREGELYVKKEKYRLSFLDTESWFDGKTLWSYLPDADEVNITEPDPGESSFFSNPSRLFSGYQQHYKYLYLGTDSETGDHIIDLVPMELNRDYSKIRISVDPKSYQLVTARYFGKDGIHHYLQITEFDASSKKPDSFFVFNPKDHPGVEVIDMRF